MTLHTSTKIEVRPKNLSQCLQINQNSSNSLNSNTTNNKVPSSGLTHSSQSTPQSHRMVGDDMHLPVFNGNGSQDPKKHFFLCKMVWPI